MMSKTKKIVLTSSSVFLVLLVLYVLGSPLRLLFIPHSFEKFRDEVVNDWYADSSWARQLDESGLGMKLRNAPNRDSFDYYNHLFSMYNDSVLKSQEHKDSVSLHN